MQKCQENSGLVQDISHISVSFNGGPYKFTCFCSFPISVQTIEVQLERTETEVLEELETEQHQKPPIEEVTGESEHVCSMVYSGTLGCFRFNVKILVCC